MTDEDAAEFYGQAQNQEPGERVGKRSSGTLSKHVPIRFQADVIESVRKLARIDGTSVSTWIRVVVDREVERRMAQLLPTITTGPLFTYTPPVAASQPVTSSEKPKQEFKIKALAS